MFDATSRTGATPPPAPNALSRIARRRRRRNIWLAASMSLVVLGIAGSALGARLVAQGDERSAHTAFTASAADIASTLSLSLQHEEDLVVSARAFIVGSPQAMRHEFDRWTVSLVAPPATPSSKAAERSCSCLPRGWPPSQPA